jgi:hypothetical protein
MPQPPKTLELLLDLKANEDLSGVRGLPYREPALKHVRAAVRIIVLSWYPAVSELHHAVNGFD